jgi:hypothetical protein
MNVKVKIERNMFVRTVDGIIGKVEDIDYGMCDEIKLENERVSQFDIIKSSFEIINLIEKDDMINGDLIVQNFGTYLTTRDTYESLFDGIQHYCIIPEDIESIVTHEQIKKVEYIPGKYNTK